MGCVCVLVLTAEWVEKNIGDVLLLGEGASALSPCDGKWKPLYLPFHQVRGGKWRESTPLSLFGAPPSSQARQEGDSTQGCIIRQGKELVGETREMPWACQALP